MMGNRNRAETEIEACLNEALLFATICIIGMPVDVHVRDGSVYSGTFHTASVDKEYGIVLKEAKLTKKGKCDANVANGNVIETLVILSGDLVQVVAKGVLFPADGFMGNIASDNVEAAVVSVPSSEILMSGAKESNKSTTDKKKVNENRNNSVNGFMPTKTGKEHEEVEVLTNHAATATEIEPGKRERINISKIEGAFDSAVIGRQIGDNWSKGEENHHKQFELQKEKSDNEVQSSSSISNLSLSETKVVGEGQKMTKLLPNGVSCDTTSALVKPDNQCHGRPTSAGAICSSVSTVSNTLIDVASESCSGSLHSSADVVSPQSSESSKSSKEFKLNPGAKIFCPSFATPISVSTAVPGVASMSYIPSNSPMVPIAAAQPEVGISPFIRPSAPAKFASYTNLTAVNGGNDLQFSPPIMGNRTLPRYSGQYPAVQTAPTYVPPNSQAVMVGRLGQLVYVQPVPHDLVQSGATIAPVSARPLLTQHQVQYPKHQGCITGQALQLCAPPPFVAGGQQPYAIPSHIPLLQPPIPANRPLPVPGANPFFGTKFP